MPSEANDAAKIAIRQLGNLATVIGFLNQPGNRAALVGETVRTRAVIKDGLEMAEEDPENRAELEQVLDTGRGALQKIAAAGESAELTPAEQVAVQAVFHLVARPAILIQKNLFGTPPERWAKPLRQEKSSIAANLPCVGAIERISPAGTELAGTGFLCAPGVVMTNRHVIEAFADKQGGAWTFAAGYEAGLDFSREKDTKTPKKFRVKEAIGDHPDPRIDLALLRVGLKSREGSDLPPPLRIAKTKPDFQAPRQVYVVGYPIVPKQHTPSDVLARIFAGIYNVKRLQPGLTLEVNEDARNLGHDCSTLGGNSGSPVIDLATNKVIGLHYFGIYRQSNQAVALWMLAGDSFLKKEKVQFE